MFIYALTNELMPGFCKVGISKDPDARVESLYGPWKVYKTWSRDDAPHIEAKVKHRLRNIAAFAHELFNCPVSLLAQTIEEELGTFLPYLPDVNRSILLHSSEDIGNIVRELRKSSNLTQEQLAGASGVGVRLIVDIESGKPTCQTQKVITVLTMLGAKLVIEKPATEPV